MTIPCSCPTQYSDPGIQINIYQSLSSYTGACFALRDAFIASTSLHQSPARPCTVVAHRPEALVAPAALVPQRRKHLRLLRKLLQPVQALPRLALRWLIMVNVVRTLFRNTSRIGTDIRAQVVLAGLDPQYEGSSRLLR